MRVDKYLASLGLCSRRNAENFLKDNKVMLGKIRILESGTRLKEQDLLTINGKIVKKPKLLYFMLNKPKGIITTASDEYGRQNVISFIKTKERIFPIGRLDKDTHGLILLTNDGDLTNKLTHPKFHVPKIYEARILGKLTAKHLEAFAKGIMLEEGRTQPAQVKIVSTNNKQTLFQVTLHEGRKRQIRRMCQALKLDLIDLMRITFGNLKLGELKTGKYRELTAEEISRLKELKTQLN